MSRGERKHGNQVRKWSANVREQEAPKTILHIPCLLPWTSEYSGYHGWRVDSRGQALSFFPTQTVSLDPVCGFVYFRQVNLAVQELRRLFQSECISCLKSSLSTPLLSIHVLRTWQYLTLSRTENETLKKYFA